MATSSSVKTSIAPARITDQPDAHGGPAPTLPIRAGAKPHASLDRNGILTPSERPGALGRLDHYEVLEVCGHGGFGIVFKAWDERLQRVVALKVLAPHRAAGALARARFLREARAAASVHDDHVVAIFAVEEEPCTYLVMEYVEGPTLQEKLDGAGPLPLEAIVHIGHQIACGLAAAHDQGLIHRDIKPSNILLENGAQVKITDFGLARAVDDVSLSQSGVVYGTPAYMAPEQASGARIDHRADLFSLGSLLYTLATGTLPFGSANSLTMLRSIIDEPSRPMRALRPELPEWFEEVIARLHAKKPAERYQTAREVADCLGRQRGEHETHVSAYRPTATPARARRWLKAVLLCAALVVGASAAWLAGFAPGTPRSAPPRSAPQLPPTLREPPLAVAPFEAADARAHQEAWAGHLHTPVEQLNSLGMRLRLVPPGEFGVVLQVPHVVRLTKPFYLAVHEVTVAQYRAFANASGHKTHAEVDPQGGILWVPKQGTIQRPTINWRSPGFPQTDDHPACCLAWNDAAAFCLWLSEHEGKPYRLPTEAEWEFACRAGTLTPFHFGPELDREQMNAGGRGTAPVGAYAANAFGMHDMHGNVFEWCCDVPRAYAPGLAIDPIGPRDGPKRVLRGGCYSSREPLLRSEYRGSQPASHAYSGIGLRVVLECR